MTTANLFKDLDKQIKEDKSSMGAWSSNYFNMHRNRYKNDLELLSKYYTDGEILEVGSAPYHVTSLVKMSGYPIVGVDISPDRQKEFIQQQNLDIIQCNIETEKLPFEDNKFKYIIFNEIFEHLRINPIKTLREINRVLHPSGVLILSTPNLYSIQNLVNISLGKGFDDPYDQFSKIENLGHMGHVREYSVSQVLKFLENTGFKSKEVQRKSFLPLTGAWSVLNPVRKFIPQLNTVQIHIAQKV